MGTSHLCIHVRAESHPFLAKTNARQVLSNNRIQDEVKVEQQKKWKAQKWQAPKKQVKKWRVQK